MFFKTPEQCAASARHLGLGPDELTRLSSFEGPIQGAVRFAYENATLSFVSAARAAMESWVSGPYYLLWIHEWNVWPSHENLHLYYRLRQSYGDYRSLREAPGHEYLQHETADAVSFLELAFAYGWGGFLLATRGVVYFSHDGWARVISDEPKTVLQAVHGWKLEARLESVEVG